MKKYLILTIIILMLAVGVAGFWYWQRNPYSKDVLRLEILGPSEIAMAEEIEYTIRYKNNGNVRLEEPRLVFEFPEHTLLEEGVFRRQEITDLEDIYPGEERTFTFRGRLIGRESEVKTARAWLHYRPKNLNATYESATTLVTRVTGVPLTFDFDLPSKVGSGREFQFAINYFSNADYPLSDLSVRVDYPNGFEFIDSTPHSLGKNEWDLPFLNKTDGGRIEIEGRVTGEVRDQKLFRAELGIWQQGEFVALKEINRGVEITEPGLFVFQLLNGEREYVAEPNDLLHYEIFFRNIGSEPFINLFLVAKLEGNVLDFGSLKVDKGQINQSDGSIVWDWRDVDTLRFLEKGEEGKVEFWVDLKKNWEPARREENIMVKNSILISETKHAFETKMNSQLVVEQKGYYQDEVFGNTGPIPPKVGDTTTYTIMWRAENHHNDVKNVTVRAVLPPYVHLTGKIFPESESSQFAFDNQSREIVWRIGDGQVFAAGTGIRSGAATMAFQVSVRPQPGHKGRAIPIIQQVQIQGEDQWTESFLKKTDESITTALPDDLTVTGDEGEVE